MKPWNPWRPEERAFITRNWGILTDEQIGEHLGRTYRAVEAERIRMELIGKPGPKGKDLAPLPLPKPAPSRPGIEPDTRARFFDNLNAIIAP